MPISINLFWRIPANDELFNSINSNFNINNYIFKEESLKKIFKALIPSYIDAEIRKNKIPILSAKIHDYKDDMYVISDYPILFRTIPNTFDEFGSIDFLMPICSKRMYHATDDKIINYSDKMAQHYNLQAINQAKKYVASGNKILLENNVNLYKKFINEIPKWRENAFSIHKNKTI